MPPLPDLPDLPAPDHHEPDAEFVADLRRLLADPEFQRTALVNALDYAQAVGFAAWESEPDATPRERLLMALERASEALISLGVAIEAMEQGGVTEEGKREVSGEPLEDCVRDRTSDP